MRPFLGRIFYYPLLFCQTLTEAESQYCRIGKQAV